MDTFAELARAALALAVPFVKIGRVQKCKDSLRGDVGEKQVQVHLHAWARIGIELQV